MTLARIKGSSGRRPSTTHCRTGTTLVELLVAMAITLIVGGAAMLILFRQQRLFTSMNTLLSTRATVRDAADILTADLRTLAPRLDALRSVSDTAIELYSTIGVSTIEVIASPTKLTLPADSRPDGTRLTHWLATPDADDDALIYMDSTATNPTRGWYRVPIATRTGTGPYTLTLAMPVPPTTTVGTPIRVVRHGRYSVYRASDRFWYLGYRRCPRTGACTTVQPLSGPYDNGTSPPITFHCVDATGTRLSGSTSLTTATRLEILAHARSATIIHTLDTSHDHATDSTLTTITFRNQ